MVIYTYHPQFKKRIQKLDPQLKERVKKQIRKILSHPEIGKPMRHGRRGTREVYIDSFRLSYAFTKSKIEFLYFYHKDEQ